MSEPERMCSDSDIQISAIIKLKHKQKLIPLNIFFKCPKQV